MDDRICKVTEKLGDEKKLDTALLIKGYRHFSEAQKKIKDGLKELNYARELIDEALIKIAGPEEK